MGGVHMPPIPGSIRYCHWLWQWKEQLGSAGREDQLVIGASEDLVILPWMDMVTVFH